MKLFYKPGACSQATHITLRELGLAHKIEEVDTRQQRTASGQDYSGINPKGYVPALQLASGEVLTEGPAILQFLADSYAPGRLAPEAGTIDRAKLNGLLNFLASELHKVFSPFFSNEPPQDTARKKAEARVLKKVAYLEQQLEDGRTFLTGETFSIADAHAFVLLSWATPVGISLDAYPRVQRFFRAVAQRPSVRQARQAEGLPVEAA